MDEQMIEQDGPMVYMQCPYTLCRFLNPIAAENVDCTSYPDDSYTIEFEIVCGKCGVKLVEVFEK